MAILKQRLSQSCLSNIQGFNMKFMPALRTTAIAAVLGASSFANAATLVQNGSFEDTVLANGTFAIFNSLPGWTTDTGNGIEVRNNAVGTAQDGNNFVELDTRANSSMMQTISTVLGQVYQLTFWYSPRINMPANTNGVEAWWGNTLLTTPAITGIGGTSNKRDLGENSLFMLDARKCLVVAARRRNAGKELKKGHEAPLRWSNPALAVIRPCDGWRNP